MFNFSLDCYYGRLGVRKYYVFRDPALGDQVKYQVNCFDLYVENQGFSKETFFNLNFSIDDTCVGCNIILFRSICEDMAIIGIFLLDFYEFFLEMLLSVCFFIVFTEIQVWLGGGVIIFEGGAWIKLFCEF